MLRIRIRIRLLCRNTKSPKHCPKTTTVSGILSLKFRIRIRPRDPDLHLVMPYYPHTLYHLANITLLCANSSSISYSFPRIEDWIIPCRGSGSGSESVLFLQSTLLAHFDLGQRSVPHSNVPAPDPDPHPGMIHSTTRPLHFL
jgi:hypothetical protein